MDMIEKLIRKFASTITIDVFPDRFIFRRDAATVEKATTVDVKKTRDKWEVVAVGRKGKSDLAGCFRIELFENQNNHPTDLDKINCLSAYFSDCIVELNGGKTTMIKPNVVFINTRKLKNRLCGYHDDILATVARMTGAASVEMKQDEDGNMGV